MFPFFTGRQSRRPLQVYKRFFSSFVGADAHIGPHNIRTFSGKRRDDVGIAPYIIIQKF